MPNTSYGPWEQEEGSDYDDPNSGGGGDSHEAEDEDVYPEQQPKGDPDRPDDAWWEHQYGGAVDHYEDLAEDLARLNKIAGTYDPDDIVTSEATALNSVARRYDPDDSSTSDVSALDPFGDTVAESSQVSLSSQLSSPDPDDFDRAESVVHVGPPIPESAAGEPDLASSPSVDPAVPFADALEDTSLSPSSPLISADRFDPGDSYQAAIVDDVGGPTLDSAAGEPEAADFEFRPDLPEQRDWNDFIG